MNDKLKSVDWKGFVAYITFSQLVLGWLKTFPLTPSSWQPSIESLGVLATQIVIFFAKSTVTAPGVTPDVTPSVTLPSGADTTGPADDVHPDVVTQAISQVLPPMVVAAAPDLPGNITKEIGRVLRRGIRW